MKELLPEEAKDIALNYIVLNLLVIAMNKDIEAIRNSSLKLKEHHALFMEKVRDMAIKDTSKTKKEMARKGIKVFDREHINEDFVRYKYVVRGYESEFRFFIHGLKMQTGKKLDFYYNSL
ncbi:hypothetical protein FAY30_26580 (plasmid) [Bacillus sp. S3]|uniref:hypothetical protein n=1 Tax=Bacillus sp. S3 TaxID=486398 RepID=UPI00118BB3B7|nr:hypothetical protein [Bacillus sp. S3]QCJ45507.1 hypothetical protein FAY30_26580 [Bacillus sp. S3]